MKQNSKRLVSIVLALLFLILALVLFFDLVEPTYSNLETTKGQLIGEQTFLATESQAVTQAQQLIAEYQNESQGEQDAALAMPTGPDIAGALAQAYGIAQSNDVAIETINASTPTLQVQSQASPGTTEAVKPLGTILLQVTGLGSYESLMSFLSELETNIRIFDLKGITIQPAQIAAVGGKGSAPATQDIFTYNLTVAVYYQTP